MNDRFKIKIMLIITAFVLLASLGLKIQRDSVPVVTAVKIAPLDIECILTSPGVIKAKKTENIVTDTPVIARKINVKKGDTVKRGDILAEVDVASTGKMLGTALGGLQLNGTDIESVSAMLAEYGVNYDISSYNTDLSDIIKKTEIPKVIKSSIDGIVTEVNIEENLASNYGKAAFCVSGSNEMSVISDIGENYIESVKVGMPVIIEGSGFSEKKYSGVVTDIAGDAKKKSSVGNKSAFVEVTVDIKDEDSLIRPGYNATVNILTDNKKDIIIVPYSAVRQDEKGNEFVYIYENGRAYKRGITTGEELESGFEVLSGLYKDDVIITQPDRIKTNGCMVTIISSEED